MTAKRPELLQARRPIAKSTLTERDRSPPPRHAGPREIIAKQSRRQVLRQLLVLADGSQVLLDSQSALDVRFDDQRRLLHLHSGAMLEQTGQCQAALLAVTRE